MKIVIWNCRGAYREKSSHISRFRPDIAVIPECEQDAEESLAPTNKIWFENNGKGLGVFSYSGLTLKAHTRDKLKHCFPVEVSGKYNFNLLAVWPVGSSVNRKSAKIIGGSIEEFHGFLDAGDTVVAGDFNSHSKWDKEAGSFNHSDLVSLLAKQGLVSAYHAFYDEQQGQESRFTHYQSPYLLHNKDSNRILTGSLQVLHQIFIAECYHAMV